MTYLHCKLEVGGPSQSGRKSKKLPKPGRLTRELRELHLFMKNPEGGKPQPREPKPGPKATLQKTNPLYLVKNGIPVFLFFKTGNLHQHQYIVQKSHSSLTKERLAPRYGERSWYAILFSLLNQFSSWMMYLNIIRPPTCVLEFPCQRQKQNHLKKRAFKEW